MQTLDAESLMINGLHHAAYRCRNSSDTRAFYEDFLELKFTHALKIEKTATGRGAQVLHTFFQMGDGSFIAFFEEPDEPFNFKDQRDFDLHLALHVDKDTLERMFKKGKEWGVETRGVSDHGFIESIYFRDPNGYVVELTTPKDGQAADRTIHARRILDDWTSEQSD
jgi:catechol 2,3-dioxygenase-like lactoylglutathione lyase family enzyme